MHLSQLRRGVHHSAALQRAFGKYGESALKFQKVALCQITDLIVLEQRFIDRLQPKYNCSPTAGSTTGLKLGPLSPEHRRRIGDAHKGRKLSDAVKARIGDVHRGKKLSPEHIRRMSELNSGEGNPFFGKRHAPETLAKVSGDNHHSARSVICVETGIRFPSITAASSWLRENGKPSASRSPILSCCNGSSRYSKAYGYTWRFEVARTIVTPDMFEEVA